MTLREREPFGPPATSAGFTRYQLLEGLEAGVEMIEIRDGEGLRLGVCPSRGLDLPFAEFRGVNLTFHHVNGVVHPSFYGADNFDWLRGAPHGLLSTCGLASVGPPCEVEGERFSLHDRITWLPAREVSTRTHEVEGRTVFEVEGEVRQARLFGANLRLKRRVRVPLGEGRIELRDTVCNDGFERAPFCLLYHCNLGWPLLGEGARVLLDSVAVPRDEIARAGIDDWERIGAPTNAPEQAFFHDVRPDEAGACRAALWNPALGLGIELRYLKAQLPYFTQWKHIHAGEVALGLEPSNVPLRNRAQLLAAGTLPHLEAGEARTFEMEWKILESL